MLELFRSLFSIYPLRLLPSINSFVNNACRKQYHCYDTRELNKSEVRPPRCVCSITRIVCVLHIQSNTTTFHLAVQWVYSYIFRPYISWTGLGCELTYRAAIINVWVVPPTQTEYPKELHTSCTDSL